MKTGTVTSIYSVNVQCPYCQGECVEPEDGSFMIESHHAIVRCLDCDKEVRVPANAFKPRKR